MYLTKKHLSRRTVLRGMGATVALPFLEAMVPARTALAKTAAAGKTRLSCIEMVHGAAGSTQFGLALETFDVTGAWRIKDNGVTVDPSGELYDGTKLDGPVALRAALLRHREVVMRTLTENLMAYGLGRRLAHFDMPAVRGIVRDAAASGNRFSSLVLGIVKSPAFQMSRAEAASTN